MLGVARDESLRPYLALSQARALSYDAAADTSRYLVSANLAYYREDFTRKSDCLVRGGGCGIAGGGLAVVAAGRDVSPYQSRQVVDRWLAYRRLGLLTACDAAAVTDDEAVSCAAGSIRAQGSSAQANAVSSWIKDWPGASSPTP
jgi:hypothetical protein